MLPVCSDDLSLTIFFDYIALIFLCCANCCQILVLVVQIVGAKSACSCDKRIEILRQKVSVIIYSMVMSCATKPSSSLVFDRSCLG